MTVEFDCFVTDQGFAAMRIVPAQDAVFARFFEAGIQSWPDAAADVLARAEEVAAGKSDMWEGGGNDYVARLSATTARIWSYHEGREIQVGLDDFLRAARAWHTFVAGLDSSSLAEGDDPAAP